MFYTVTVNPSLDYVMNVDTLQMGQTNRSGVEEIGIGGKGINVSIMLQHLGVASRAAAFVAGFTGGEIERLLTAEGVTADFIHIAEGFSRINVKLHSKGAPDASGKIPQRPVETEINGAGPKITDKDIAALTMRLDTLAKGDTLVLSGNIPPTLPKSLYSDIIKRQEGKEVRIVVDATGQLLRECLKYKPFLVKPNTAELGELYGVTLKTQQDVAPYAVKLRGEGAQNVLISMGKYGAVLAADDGKVYLSPAPDGKVVNTVGSGDSMVAGFLAGYDGKVTGLAGGARDALVTGLSAGSASAFQTGLASGEKVLSVVNSFVSANGISTL